MITSGFVGLGSLINVVTITVAALLGTVLGSRIRASMQETLLYVCGLVVIVFSLAGTLAATFTVTPDGSGGYELHTSGTLMMLISLALGTIIGELLGIEAAIERGARWLQARSRSEGDTGFVSAFMTATCTVSIGAMAVVGAVQDGLGNPSVLLAKSVIDAVTVCVMAASLGRGTIFAGLSAGVFLLPFLLATVVAGDFLPAAALHNLDIVGNVVIIGVGLNLVRDRKLRVANLLPALVIAMVWGCVAG